MEKSKTSPSENKVRFVWKTRYTWVLVLNALYILLFYLLTKSFA